MPIRGEAAQKAVDTRALEVAAGAEARLEDHQRYCEERDQRLNDKIDGVASTVGTVRDSVGKVHKRVDQILWAWIGGMGALVVSIAAAAAAILLQ